METQTHHNPTRPRVFKKVTVTPNDWMKIYEKKKGELVFDGAPQLRPGQAVVFIAVNTDSNKELKGLPKLVRSVLSVEQMEESQNQYIVKIGEDL